MHHVNFNHQAQSTPFSPKTQFKLAFRFIKIHTFVNIFFLFSLQLLISFSFKSYVIKHQRDFPTSHTIDEINYLKVTSVASFVNFVPFSI